MCGRNACILGIHVDGGINQAAYEITECEYVLSWFLM